MIRAHRVQEARAVFAGHADFAATGNVQPRRAAAKLVVALHGSSILVHGGLALTACAAGAIFLCSSLCVRQGR